MLALSVAALAGVAVGTAVRAFIVRRATRRLDRADASFRSAH